MDRRSDTIDNRVQLLDDVYGEPDAFFAGRKENRLTLASSFGPSASRYRYTWGGIHFYTVPKLSHGTAFWFLLVLNWWYPSLIKHVYESCIKVLASKGVKASAAEVQKGLHLDYGLITQKSIMLGYNTEEDTLFGLDNSFIVEIHDVSKYGDELSWRCGLSTFKR